MGEWVDSLIQDSENRYFSMLVRSPLAHLAPVLFLRLRSPGACPTSHPPGLQQLSTAGKHLATLDGGSVSLVQGLAQKRQDPRQLTASDCWLCSREVLSHHLLFYIPNLERLEMPLKRESHFCFSVLESCILRMLLRLYFLGKSQEVSSVPPGLNSRKYWCWSFLLRKTTSLPLKEVLPPRLPWISSAGFSKLCFVPKDHLSLLASECREHPCFFPQALRREGAVTLQGPWLLVPSACLASGQGRK